MDYHQPVVSAFRPTESLRVLDYTSSMEAELRIIMIFQMGIAKRCQEYPRDSKSVVYSDMVLEE